MGPLVSVWYWWGKTKPCFVFLLITSWFTSQKKLVCWFWSRLQHVRKMDEKKRQTWIINVKSGREMSNWGNFLVLCQLWPIWPFLPHCFLFVCLFCYIPPLSCAQVIYRCANSPNPASLWAPVAKHHNVAGRETHKEWKRRRAHKCFHISGIVKEREADGWRQRTDGQRCSKGQSVDRLKKSRSKVI